MKIREFQQRVADALNGHEEFVQGGCKAFAEDQLDLVGGLNRQLSMARGIGVVVTTPEFSRNGCRDGGIPVETRLSIVAMEKPAINRGRSGAITALDAAELVASALDGEQFNLTRIFQTADEQKGVVSATAEFNVQIVLN